MNIKQYVQDICDSIDAVRADLWATQYMTGVVREGVREPVDKFGAAHARQSARAEIWSGIMAYREEEIDFSELLMFLQSFDSTVTPDDVYALLGDKYYG